MPTFQPRAGRPAVTACYEDLERLVILIANRFSRRYGADREETLAKANLLFLQAYHTHDPDRGPLRKRVPYYIWHRLLDEYRAPYRNGSVPPRFTRLGTQVAAPEPISDDTWISWLTADAREVARLVIEAPGELHAALHEARTPESAQHRLRRYLRAAGWLPGRIAAAFNELREVL